MTSSFSISGNIIDILNRNIYSGTITVEGNIISKISKNVNTYDNYILPGFIDSHIHIESSMLVPSEFAKLAVVHGTVATVSDPHEIANVLGIKGVKYMIENSRKVPFKIFFGAPSCVPATSFETAGAEITSSDIKELFDVDKLKYLSEMMNYPGVLFDDPVVMDKIHIAIMYRKPIDGHAPGLKGIDAKKYISAGIITDHECYSLEEALDKIKYGMKILIREGSAAKNFETLHTLIRDYPDMVLLCSDDKHPDDLIVSHINNLVVRSIEKGYDLFDVLKCACINPVLHYDLDVGLLKEGDFADFIVVDNLKSFKVQKTYINGTLVAENGISKIGQIEPVAVNNFNCKDKVVSDFKIPSPHSVTNDGVPTNPIIRVIETLDGELITNEVHSQALLQYDNVVSDVSNDVLKLCVINRYVDSKPAIAFIKNFGLKKGAIASSIAHDSHNIISVGVRDEDICNAVNAVIETKGGISVVYNDKIEILPLPVAGIMSDKDGYFVAEKYSVLNKLVKELGSSLHTPFMTLSFMALLVIPQLKLSDKGLFDGSTFKFTELFVN